jgi:hypothetical protein
MVSGLGRILPNPMVSVSTFYSGTMIPIDYAHLWKFVSQQTGVRVLFQDGYGTLTLKNEAQLVKLKAIRDAGFPRENMGIIVELFRPVATDGDFQARSVFGNELELQLRQISEIFPLVHKIGFSHKYLMQGTILDTHGELFAPRRGNQ